MGSLVWGDFYFLEGGGWRGILECAVGGKRKEGVGFWIDKGGVGEGREGLID